MPGGDGRSASAPLGVSIRLRASRSVESYNRRAERTGCRRARCALYRERMRQCGIWLVCCDRCGTPADRALGGCGREWTSVGVDRLRDVQMFTSSASGLVVVAARRRPRTPPSRRLFASTMVVDAWRSPSRASSLLAALQRARASSKLNRLDRAATAAGRRAHLLCRDASESIAPPRGVRTQPGPLVLGRR
jgi:hypothetical protein